MIKDFLNESIIDNPIAYDDFIKDDRYDLKELSFDDQTIAFWKNRNFYTQMMDIWGEVDKARNAYISWTNSDNEDKRKAKFSALVDKLRFVRECLAIVKENNNFEEKVKKTFRIAEWELYDFFFWDNMFCNSVDTVTNWFDQWCFSINPELLAS